MKPYVIRQGDYLVRLSHILSFDAEEVWNHPKNADLRKKRPQHSLLVPGDVIYIPDEPPKRNKYRAHSDNSYVAHVPRIRVRVAMSMAGKPMASETYFLRGIGEDEKERTTDGNGNVEIDASVHVREVEAYFPKRKLSRSIKLGGLDPVDETSGLKMRLAHLGYFDPHGSAHPDCLKAALIAFQAANGLPATGVLDDAAKRAILAAHGS